MEPEIGLILAYGLGIAFLYIAGYFFLAPMKVLAKLFFNSIIGGAALIVIDFLGIFFTFHLPINIFSAIITGFLGVPGVLLLIIFEKIA